MTRISCLKQCMHKAQLILTPSAANYGTRTASTKSKERTQRVGLDQTTPGKLNLGRMRNLSHKGKQTSIRCLKNSSKASLNLPQQLPLTNTSGRPKQACKTKPTNRSTKSSNKTSKSSPALCRKNGRQSLQ